MIALPISTSSSPSRMVDISFLLVVFVVLFLFMLIFHWKAFRLFIILMAADLAALVWIAFNGLAAFIVVAAGAILALRGRGPRAERSRPSETPTPPTQTKVTKGEKK